VIRYSWTNRRWVTYEDQATKKIGQLVRTRTSILRPANHKCPVVAGRSVLTRVTYGEQVPAGTKFTNSLQGDL
jgi:hypothetical protein